MFSVQNPPSSEPILTFSMMYLPAITTCQLLTRSDSTRIVQLTLLVFLSRVASFDIHPPKCRIAALAGDIADRMHSSEQHLGFTTREFDVHTVRMIRSKIIRMSGEGSIVIDKRWGTYADRNKKAGPALPEKALETNSSYTKASMTKQK